MDDKIALDRSIVEKTIDNLCTASLVFESLKNSKKRLNKSYTELQITSIIESLNKNFKLLEESLHQ